MDPTNPKDCDALDLRPVWRAQYPSSGPAWDRAIEMGIDPVQLLANLELTPTERLLQLDEMTRLYERLHATAAAAHAAGCRTRG
ncbi:MAG: hypothetical protein MUC96_19520 [Myxococcaceae bacterium]|jgi:hypothetical protein|nr:hypothetical protein [Myxococcaceae bacterium]